MLEALKAFYRPFIFMDLIASFMNILGALITPQDDIALIFGEFKFLNLLTGANLTLPVWIYFIIVLFTYIVVFLFILFLLYLIDKQMFRFMVYYLKQKIGRVWMTL